VGLSEGALPVADTATEAYAPRSTVDDGFSKPRRMSGTASGQARERCQWQMKRPQLNGSGRKNRGNA